MSTSKNENKITSQTFIHLVQPKIPANKKAKVEALYDDLMANVDILNQSKNALVKPTSVIKFTSSNHLKHTKLRSKLLPLSKSRVKPYTHVVVVWCNPCVVI